MTTEICIPILPCRSIKDTLEFYGALGFVVTYQQTRPNTYAAVQRDGIELHFFVMKEYNPAQSYSTCYVRVSAVDDLYQAFTRGLRQHYGKLPTVGIPRISTLKNKSYGVREFIVTDVGGNAIRIGQPLDSTGESDHSPLSRALQAALQVGDSKGEPALAAALLDKALAQQALASSMASTATQFQALVARAGWAIVLNDYEVARTMLQRAQQMKLSIEERAALGVDLERANDLERELDAPPNIEQSGF